MDSQTGRTLIPFDGQSRGAWDECRDHAFGHVAKPASARSGAPEGRPGGAAASGDCAGCWKGPIAATRRRLAAWTGRPSGTGCTATTPKGIVRGQTPNSRCLFHPLHFDRAFAFHRLREIMIHLDPEPVLARPPNAFSRWIDITGLPPLPVYMYIILYYVHYYTTYRKYVLICLDKPRSNAEVGRLGCMVSRMEEFGHGWERRFVGVPIEK